ncbi:LEA type 2 family protein [Haloplanus aerogenes]|uniref:Water stress and hypersensitive response domain-containing protein n=2 Tax=Haloplanus aerogenes TaxID=660522 RepID=A0A3G8QU37_9EURY|nr:LEA type 2 family protein [Haloplanus aerogenes]AZH25966.1 hypothetical protein DU502_11550 [Haloplanus aerogenes]
MNERRRVTTIFGPIVISRKYILSNMSQAASTVKRLAAISVIALVVTGLAVYGPPIGFAGDTDDADDDQARRSADAPLRPSITSVDSRFSDVTGTETAVKSDVRVRVPAAAREGDVVVDYAVAMNDVQMASTERRVAINRGTTTALLTTRFSHDRIVLWWVNHIRNEQRTERTVTVSLRTSGNTPDRVEKRRTIETAMLSEFNSTATRPVGSNVTGGRSFLYVKETTARWASIDSSNSRIEVRLVAYNPNAYPVPIYGFGYRATMNGIEMGKSVSETRGVIPPRSNRTVRLTVTLDHDRLDEWWRTHLERGETTEFRIDFSTRAESQSGVVQLPLDSLTYTHRIETELFANRTGTGVQTATTSSRVLGTPGESTISVVDLR